MSVPALPGFDVFDFYRSLADSYGEVSTTVRALGAQVRQEPVQRERLDEAYKRHFQALDRLADAILKLTVHIEAHNERRRQQQEPTSD